MIFVIFFQFRLRKEELRTEINGLLNVIQNLDQNVTSSKTQLDDINAKDQSIDRQFRSIFAELVSPAIIDQAYRIFK